MRGETRHFLRSEAIEPAMMYILKKMVSQVEEASERDLQDACFYLWGVVCSIDKIAMLCNMKGGPEGERPIHFSLAASNEKGKVAEYIRWKLGFNPWHDKDNAIKKQWDEALSLR